MKQYKTIIYDGECNLCNGVVSWINKSSKEEQIEFRFVHFQSGEGQTFLKQNNFRLDDLETVIVIENDFYYTHSEAFLQIIQHLTYWKKIGKMVKLIPILWRDKIYKIAAKNRIKWFGLKSNKSCELIIPD